MKITTRFKQNCEKIQNDQCEVGKFCILDKPYSVGARKHLNVWAVHDVNSDELEAIKANHCMEIKAKKKKPKIKDEAVE